ncbi:MAG: monomeric [FeFe] hydrogenase [Candidatus Gastranaerophilales bacterium]|nr:monomeric [FeFe] hydrogenase [Candidatus Gastranaerophilales bacterium]
MNTNSETQAAHLKKEILIRIVKAFNSNDFEKNTRLIPFDMRPKGSEVPFRCCIYKERAILKDRTIAGLGFAIEDDDERKSLTEYANEALQRDAIDEKPLTVLDAACKGCVPSRVFVTDLCQGCVARPCTTTCKFGAISIKDNRSVIDGSKCKSCKMCISACPYNAIVQIKVPCEDSCPVGAITKNEHGLAEIDFEKCISCGKCVSACPFGAVHEKSQIIDIMKNLKSEKKVIAMIAPSIAGQFPGTMGQLKSAMIKAGFSDVYEVAQGADITTQNEANEFAEKLEENAEFMTTSCCAGYNELVKKHIPEILPFKSGTGTPLYYTAEIVKQDYPDALTVFVSPCVAKRKEGMYNEKVDFVMNYEELGALLIGSKIEITACDESTFVTESSKQARNFGVTGGVAAAVTAASNSPEKIKQCLINGLNKQTIRDLKKMAKTGKCDCGNLVEVMCCEGGCMGGNATINSKKTAFKKLAEYTNLGKDIQPNK